MAGDDRELARFLRARRERLSPVAAGLPDRGDRRVPGLRREELALLAGISPNYYVRLEQGHSRRPSADVVDSLARALQLGEQERRHLHALAARPAAAPPVPEERELVRPELARMLDHHVGAPAFVLGAVMDVLAANTLARALHPSFRPGRNIVRDVFLDRAAMAAYPDPAPVQRNAVASLRKAAGLVDDARVTGLVEELTARSPAFGDLWARHEVRDKIAGTKRFILPEVGEVELDYDSFAVSGAGLQQLVVYHAAPGSAAAQALARLGDGGVVTADSRSDQRSRLAARSVPASSSPRKRWD